MSTAAIGPNTYLKTLIWLMGLAALSFGLSYLPLGAAEIPIALVIALVKALLVALFFMHLLEARFSSVLALMAALAFVLLLVSLTAGDILTRAPPPLLPPAR